jgi:hypothetical protein
MQDKFGPIKNQKDQAPLNHYLALYKTLDPAQISRRCGLAFDAAEPAFSLRLMGTEYRAAFPDFHMRDASDAAAENISEKLLILRYLCEGKHTEPAGKQLSYHEIPWGELYYRNFEGRCIKRLAHTFGNDIAGFRRIIEGMGSLRPESLPQGDAGYRFEFMSGLCMSLLLWAGDEEFPPSAQILFDDNFAAAFTAEDIAVAGEIVIARLKKMRQTAPES